VSSVITGAPSVAQAYDRYSVVIAASIIYTMALLVPFTMPALIGLVAEQWSMSGSQLGIWASAYALSLGLTGISSFYWVRRLNWRIGVWGGMLMLGISMGLHVIATDFYQLLILMLFGGAGGGLASAITIAVLGEGSNPQRNFGVMIFATVVIPAIVIASIPLVTANGGYTNGILMVAALITASCILIVVLPISGKLSSDKVVNAGMATTTISGGKVSNFRMPFAVLSMFLFIMGFMGAWSFLERIGNQSGLEQGSMYNAIAVGQLIGGLGGFFAIFICRYIGLRGSFVLANILAIITLAGLNILDITLIVYFVMIASFMLWIMVNMSNITSYIAKIDSRGRVVSMIPGLQSFGSFVGSIIAGFAFEQSGKTGVVTASIVAFLLCIICMLSAFRFSLKEELDLQP